MAAVCWAAPEVLEKAASMKKMSRHPPCFRGWACDEVETERSLPYCQAHIPTGPIPYPCSMCVYQPTQTMTDSLCSAEV